ncbi:MAG: VanZ family protein [Nitrospirae bacterium]|nr:VanZ family protein [Nitrospirota bacterium]
MVPRIRKAAPVWRYWIPLAVYAGLIFYLSSLSYPEDYLPSLLEDLGDKVLHAIEYAVLGILWYRAFRHAAGTWAAHHSLLLAIIASVGYGVTDELHQAFVPTREADAWDLLFDGLGSAMAALVWQRTVET